MAAPPDEREDLLKNFEGLTTPIMDSGALDLGTPSDGPAATDDPHASDDDQREHSARSLRSHIRDERKRLGI